MTEKFIRINIVFKLPDEIAESVAKISQEIAEKNEAVFVIDNKNFFPHITIYSPEYPVNNLEKILSNVEELSKKLLATKFLFEKIITNQGYIGMEFDCSEEIKKIHEAIVEKLNVFREGHVRKKYIDSYGMEFSQEKKENIQKYGYPNSMNFYNSHMTIIRLKDSEKAKKIAEEISWPIKEFMVEKLGAYRMGENGTCTELIKEFKLGK